MTRLLKSLAKALAVGSVAFAIGVFANAAEFDGAPRRFDRLDLLSIGAALVSVVANLGYSVATSPASGEYGAKGNAITEAVALFATAFGLYIATGTTDENPRARRRSVRGGRGGFDMSNVVDDALEVRHREE